MEFDGLLPLAKKMATAPFVKIYYDMKKKVNQQVVINKSMYEDPANIAQAGTICDLNAYLLMAAAAGVKRIEAMKAALRSEEALQGKKAYRSPLKELGYEDGEDRAKVFQKGDGDALSGWLETWSDFRGHGVVQFKFDPGPHTFMVERVPLATKDPKAKVVNNYRVYQGYEGVYRLVDFLGLAKDKEDAPIFQATKTSLEEDVKKYENDMEKAEELVRAKHALAHYERFVKEEANPSGGLIQNTQYVRWRMSQLCEAHANRYGNDMVYGQPFTKTKEKTYKSDEGFRDALWRGQRETVLKATAELDDMTKTIGRGRALSYGALHLHVLTPLFRLLWGDLSALGLQQLSGVPPSSKWEQSTGRLVVLMCDRTKFSEYATNYDDIASGKLDKDMTEYVTIGN